MQNISDIRRLNFVACVESQEPGGQAKIAKLIARSPAQVWQLMQGPGTENGRNIGSKLARHIEASLGMPANSLDHPPGLHGLTREPTRLYAYEIKTDQDPPEAGDAVVDVMAVELAAGDGRDAPSFVDTKFRFTYTQHFLHSNGVRDSSRVKVAYVRGPSMEPVLWDGDKVLFHLDDTRVQDDRTYVIRVGDQLRVKKLRRRRDGGLTIVSCNPAFAPEEVPPDELHTIAIIGRVIDRSGRGGL